jgi:pimeloyl-ACP methyl ester carboxylesterase
MLKKIKTAAGSISYEVTGEGLPVMLAHGFGEDGYVWNEIAASLSNEYKIIIPHLSGSYLSPIENLSLVDNITMESMAEDLHKILEAEKIHQVIMLGHSMGGYITLAFAEKHEERLHAFGLIHSTSYADSEAKKEARLKSIEFLKTHSTQSFLEVATPNLFGEPFKNNHPEKINELIERASQITEASMIAYLRAMRKRKDRTDILKKTTKPVFFCIGMQDNAVSPEDAITQSKIPPHSQTLILEEAGHQGMMEEREKLIEAIKVFIDKIEIQPR